MHTYTLVKLHAKDAGVAKAEVEDLMYDTCGDEKKFDYASVDVLTLNDKEKADFKVETFEELEAKYQEYTKNAVENTKRRVHEELQIILMRKYLPSEEAALLINSKDRRIKSAAEDVLKNGGGQDLPKNLTELTDQMSEILIGSTEDVVGMLLYYLREYSILHSALEYPDEFHTAAASPDNHYIDLTESDDSEGDENDPIFYCLVDRHY